MRVLLIATNRESLPDPVFPLGVAYVAGALEAAGHEVRTLDLCFVDDGELEACIAAEIGDCTPALIGLSLRNVDDAAYPKYTSYLELYRRVVAACRQASKAPLVVGGSAFTIMPEEFMAALDVDYGVVGEGERALVELVEQLEAGGGSPKRDRLPIGVVTRDAPSPSTTARQRRLESWSSYLPSRGHFSAADYYERGGMLNLQTRRGCPFRCVYCSYPRIEGSTMRLRPVGEAVDEMEVLVEETGVEHLFIVDSVFNHPREYAAAFCDEVIRRGVDVKWTCYAHAGRMDGELIEKMVRAGCEGVEFGTDGLVDSTLEALGKGFTFAEVQEASRLCHELGLRFCHFLFIGAPGEDVDDVRLAVDRLAELKADSSLIMAGIRIFPGTALEKRAREELGIEHVGIEPVFYISPKVVNHLEPLVEEIIAQHSSWVLPGFARNFNERIQRVIRRAGKRGVLWDFLSPR
jgi:radical SAM superfamily enzyme YgiQ (UPF0313 family)